MKKITLKNKDFDRFIKALIKPHKPNKALLDAVRENTMPDKMRAGKPNS